MPRYSLVVVAAMLAASLFGCGQSPTPAPPSGYFPTTVADGWEHHWNAFVARDLNRVMYDYDTDSVLQVYNDACSPGVMQEYNGDGQIRGFFSELFTTLTTAPVSMPAFSDVVTNPTIDNAAIGDSFDAANVFLVWNAPDHGIDKAADTSIWRQVGPLPGYVTAIVKIKKQNIVLTQTCPDSPGETPAAPQYDNTSAVAQGWSNHFTAFNDQNLAKILMDYTESSTVQVWSWGMGDGLGYASYAGIDEIGVMFDALWTAWNANLVDGSVGLEFPVGFPRVEVDFKSVFLVWMSNSHPKAAETFLFDDMGKILRQTIVVSTTGPAPARAPARFRDVAV